MSSLGQLYLKKHLKEEQAQLEEAAQEAQDAQKKKGLFSAIGICSTNIVWIYVWTSWFSRCKNAYRLCRKRNR